jgi:carbohydrate-selective porin OprB
LPTIRLYEAYFERKWGNNVVSLKAGQLAADSEFFNTKYTDVLTNASMGWPAITSVDLPSGGPSPPLASVGARLLVNVGDNLSVLGGIFDGNQAGPGTGVSIVDRHDVLLAIDLIGHRCRLAARRNPILPQESLVAPKLAKP